MRIEANKRSVGRFSYVVEKHGLTDLYFVLIVMVTKTFAMSGGLYTYQVALGHSFVLRRCSSSRSHLPHDAYESQTMSCGAGKWRVVQLPLRAGL
jgi:hypothetical protein